MSLSYSKNNCFFFDFSLNHAEACRQYGLSNINCMMKFVEILTWHHWQIRINRSNFALPGKKCEHGLIYAIFVWNTISFFNSCGHELIFLSLNIKHRELQFGPCILRYLSKQNYLLSHEISEKKEQNKNRENLKNILHVPNGWPSIPLLSHQPI